MNDLPEATIYCPYCGEMNTVFIEPLQEEQEYIEDCQVCCRPIVFHVRPEADGSYAVHVQTENESG